MYQSNGIVIKSIGGLFSVRLFPTEVGAESAPLDGLIVTAHGRGNLRKNGELLVGDRVKVSYDESSFSKGADGSILPSTEGTNLSIEEILPRTSALIRPPMANLNYIFITVAAVEPEPMPQTIDKLICIAEHHRIEPILLITKKDQSEESANKLAAIYQKAGIKTFVTCTQTGEGTQALERFLHTLPSNSIAAFSGASGVGKSSLLNLLFPNLQLETGDLSKHIARGKNTTRAVTLYPVENSPSACLVADTPGFTLLDFERFHFFDLEDLPNTFREFSPFLGKCKYTKCSHTKEDGCQILAAVKSDIIPKSRHQSYVELYQILKKKNNYKK